MKAVRIVFLLLLAALLPVRSAVAAAMLCPAGSMGMQSELRMHEHAAGHAAMDHAMSHDHGAAHEHAGAGHAGHDGHDQAAADRCNVCSAYCSLTPLVSEVPALLQPLGLGTVKFTDYAAPPPSFVCGGQERPPRTI